MTVPFTLGLTGSIGMGKSTTAAMFAADGIPVWDADAAVHRLYAAGGAAVQPVAALFPEVLKDASIDRASLKALITRDISALSLLEAVVHPLVAADRTAFIVKATGDLLVLDIPLLFETGAETSLDATLLVTAPAALQRHRVLSRPGMTAQQFDTLLARQMPDAEKRFRATHIVETLDLTSTNAYVKALIAHIRASNA
ncbi:MAG: dephospho-CoA kinase [Paracoccaceae bacterium]